MGEHIYGVEAAQGHVAFLTETSHVLATGIDLGEILVRLARAAVPAIADWSSVYVPRRGKLQRLALFTADPAHAPLAARFAGRYGYPVDADTAVAAAFRDRRSIHTTDLPAASAGVPRQVAEAWTMAGLSETLVVPVAGAGSVHAVLALALTHGERRFTPEDRALLERVAASAAATITRAQAHEHERVLAQALVRAVLPVELVQPAGWELAARYRPAGPELDVGGDWFDGFQVGDRLVMAVGDVAGHGLSGASAMGQLRNALRAYLLDDHGPAAALARAERFLGTMEVTDDGVPPLASVLCASVRLRDGTVVLANAGHPPALLCTAAGARLVAGASRPLLGADAGQPFSEEEVEVPPGGMLLLYTDGVVEQRSTPIADRLDRLQAVVADNVALAAEPFCSAVLEAMTAGLPTDDDCCLLALRRLDRADVDT